MEVSGNMPVSSQRRRQPVAERGQKEAPGKPANQGSAMKDLLPPSWQTKSLNAEDATPFSHFRSNDREKAQPLGKDDVA